MDYSLQVEHTQPWTEILVPESQPRLSKSALFQNQDRLTSGYDLYHTLRGLMTAPLEGMADGQVMPAKIADRELLANNWSLPAIPDWSFNLLESLIPKDRTCRDAKLDPHLCREKTTSANFGTCNMLDKDQEKFCPEYQKKPKTVWIPTGFKQSAIRANLRAVGTKEHNNPCGNFTKAPGIERDWDWIGNTLQTKYPKDHISEGIFLYDRQAVVLGQLVRHISDLIDRKITICETGFGSGHSLSLFLNSVGQNAHLISFDKFERPHQLPIWEHLNETYSQNHRLEYVVGDPCQTIPQYLSSSKGDPGKIQCDVLYGSGSCPSDNIELVKNSPCGAVLTSKAVPKDNKSVYFGPKRQWTILRDRGCITNPICFKEDTLDAEKGRAVVKKNKSIFCLAITTGKCQETLFSTSELSCNKNDIVASIQRVGTRLLLECPEHRYFPK